MHFTLVGNYRWHSAFFGDQVLIDLASSNNITENHSEPPHRLLQITRPAASEMEVRDKTYCTCKNICTVELISIDK